MLQLFFIQAYILYENELGSVMHMYIMIIINSTTLIEACFLY